MRILAVDPGSKHIGVAISDPSGVLARPLLVFEHVARLADAARVAELAREQGAGTILVGQSLDEDGRPTFEGRRSARFAEALKTQIDLPVVLWDEALTTDDARQLRRESGAPPRKRRGHLDDLAAAILLQSYLESQTKP